MLILKKNGEQNFVNDLYLHFKNRAKPIIVFDIGANVGEYTEILLSESNNQNVEIELHLFEPTKSCFSILSEKFGGLKNIKLNNFGVSDSECTLPIYYDKDRSGLASLYQRDLKSYNIKMNISEEIDLKRIDNYIINNEINHIDFVKIDIEGHELKAFEGFGQYLNNNFIDFIQFEYGGANIDSRTYLKDFFNLFDNHGFHITKIMRNHLEKNEYHPSLENFIYSNFVAISNLINLK
ncbi:FkbM family methyltransferase [Candidatus Kapabacteria bacterium]|nr:FkbM family methyltransferase [Candidatus Kapabacteria bacterium]